MKLTIRLRDLSVTPTDFGYDLPTLYKAYDKGSISINGMNVNTHPLGNKNIVMLQRQINNGNIFAIDVDKYPPDEEEIHTVESQYDKEDEEEYED